VRFLLRHSPERIKAGLAYTLSEAADDGHCYLPAPNLITDAAKILDVPADLITPCLDERARTIPPGIRCDTAVTVAGQTGETGIAPSQACTQRAVGPLEGRTEHEPVTGGPGQAGRA
jgi:hypothetical protein